MQLQDIRTAYDVAHTLYGVEVENFEDIAMLGWEAINQKHTHLYKYIADADEDCSIELPCNVDSVVSVHIPIPDFQETTNKDDYYNPESLIIEKYIDGRTRNEDPLWVCGKLVKYNEANNVLYFSHPYKNVMIVYRGIIADEDSGLPLVTDKEIRAIATYVAYVTLYKEGIRKRDANAMTIAKDIYQEWLRLCNAARVPTSISDNDMDRILDAKTNWNRKQYGKSFKPIF